MIDKERLAAMAQSFGVALSDAQLAKLDDYAVMLLAWNKKMNLTAITQAPDIEIKHFLDCLILASQPELKGKSVVDVGSGAGFPGMVLGIYSPAASLCLMEPSTKRLAFLAALAEKLNIPAQLVKERAEEAARKAWRERFDVATARAVAALPALCEYCLPLVKVGGCFIAMKGDAAEELAASKEAIKTLGGGHPALREFTLPGGQRRSLVIIKKLKETPPKYPRNGAAITKRPLG